MDNQNLEHLIEHVPHTATHKKQRVLKITLIVFAVCALTGGSYTIGYLIGKRHSSANNAVNISALVAPKKKAKVPAKTTGTHLAGVVTKMGTNSFVIAGGGRARTVTTTAHTTYTNNRKPVLYDTVSIVGGAQKNGMFTATKITIDP